MKTLFYGGTFNPVHNAHLGSAREVLNCGAADQVLFVPAAVLPHTYKTAEHLTSFADRLEMVRLAVSGEKRFLCSDIESRREGKSYTLDTLRALKAGGKYGDLLLFIGSDTLQFFHTWHEVHALLREFGLVIYPRPDTPVGAIDLAAHWSSDEVNIIRKAVLPDLPQYPGSSTQIREMIKKSGVKSVFPFVRKNVADYITAHKLYI